MQQIWRWHTRTTSQAGFRLRPSYDTQSMPTPNQQRGNVLSLLEPTTNSCTCSHTSQILIHTSIQRNTPGRLLSCSPPLLSCISLQLVAARCGSRLSIYLIPRIRGTCSQPRAPVTRQENLVRDLALNGSQQSITKHALQDRQQKQRETLGKPLGDCDFTLVMPITAPSCKKKRHFMRP